MPLTQSVIFASVLHCVHMIRHIIMLNMDTYHYLHTSSHRRLLEAMLSVLKIGMRYNNAHGTNMWDIGASKLLFMASWSVFWIWNVIRWVLILQTWGLLPHVYPECNEPIDILFWILKPNFVSTIFFFNNFCWGVSEVFVSRNSSVLIKVTRGSLF